MSQKLWSNCTKKRRVFREHIFSLTGGRLLMLSFLGNAVYFWHTWLFNLQVRGTFPFLLLTLLVSVGTGYVFWHWWYRCFGWLTITEDEVIWRGLFCRTCRIKKDDIKYAGINDNYATNGIRGQGCNTFNSIYISKVPYPAKYNGKIYKLRNSSDFIKFPVSFRLCQYLSEWLRDPQKRIFEAVCHEELRMRSRKKRAKVEKKARKKS